MASPVTAKPIGPTTEVTAPVFWFRITRLDRCPAEPSAAYSTALVEMGYVLPSVALIVRLPKVETDPAFQVVTVPPAADLFPVFLAAKQLWHWTHANEAAYRARRGAARVA